MTPVPVFQQQVEEVGFACIKVDVPEEPLHPAETLFDANVPFSENFRKADSTWTVATEAEL